MWLKIGNLSGGVSLSGMPPDYCVVSGTWVWFLSEWRIRISIEEKRTVFNLSFFSVRFLHRKEVLNMFKGIDEKNHSRFRPIALAILRENNWKLTIAQVVYTVWVLFCHWSAICRALASVLF